MMTERTDIVQDDNVIPSFVKRNNNLNKILISIAIVIFFFLISIASFLFYNKSLATKTVTPTSGTRMLHSRNQKQSQLWTHVSLTQSGANQSEPLFSYKMQSANGIAALQTLYNNSSGSPSRGLFCTGIPTGTCWWESANELNTIITYMEQAHSKTYIHDIGRTFSYAANEELHSTGPFLDRYYDDDGWWAMTWINAYQLTGNIAYLHMAENIFTYIRTYGWSTACGGGVWQFAGLGQKNQLPTKDAIVNALYIALAARLYQETHNQIYLQGDAGALATMSWFLHSGYITSQGRQRYLVNGSLSSATCQPVTGYKQSNVQGMIIGALVNIYQITKNQAYLNLAQNIADAVLIDRNNSNPPLVDRNGVLTEACTHAPDCNQSPAKSYLQYKGIFMRNLYCLNNVARAAKYSAFLTQNASWLIKTYPADNNPVFYGFSWDSYSVQSPNQATQGSALDLLNALIGGSDAMCQG